MSGKTADTHGVHEVPYCRVYCHQVIAACCSIGVHATTGEKPFDRFTKLAKSMINNILKPVRPGHVK
jgi:hypothetical protein